MIGMSDDCGGIENYLFNMYEHINRNQIQFDFLVKGAIGKDFQSRITNLGGRIYETGILKKNILFTWKRIEEIIKQGTYKKIYINLSYALALLYVLPGLKNGITQVFIHSHASDDFRKMKHYISRPFLLKAINKYATGYYLGCSEEACYWMFGKKRSQKHGYQIIQNAIDYDKFVYNKKTATQVRNELGLKDAFVVGHVGRFSEEKNHSFIIRAFEELYKRNKNTRLLLIGDGYLKSEIEEQIEKLGLKDVTRLTGVVRDPERYYNVMDCFWMPSLYEGFPLVAIEAEANGLFCIFSDHITKSVDILGSNVFLPIDQIDCFVKRTEEIKKDYNRKTERKVFMNAGFDINNEVERLEKILLQ